jgi:hypothetical protein
LQFVLGARPASVAIHDLSWLAPEQALSAMKKLPDKLPTAEWASMRSARAISSSAINLSHYEPLVIGTPQRLFTLNIKASAPDARAPERKKRQPCAMFVRISGPAFSFAQR